MATLLWVTWWFKRLDYVFPGKTHTVEHESYPILPAWGKSNHNLRVETPVCLPLWDSKTLLKPECYHKLKMISSPQSASNLFFNLQWRTQIYQNWKYMKNQPNVSVQGYICLTLRLFIGRSAPVTSAAVAEKHCTHIPHTEVCAY